jgi:hypothetical protein
MALCKHGHIAEWDCPYCDKLTTTRQDVYDALKKRCEDMIGAVEVRNVHRGILLVMKDGAEFHIQITVMREGKPQLEVI